MISYKPFWKTIKEKNFSTYKLIYDYHFSSATIHRLRTNQTMSTQTINDLCDVLECSVSDIMEHIPDNDPYRKKEKRDFDF